MRVRVALAVASVTWLVGSAPTGAGGAPAESVNGVTQRVSVRSDGGQANGPSSFFNGPTSDLVNGPAISFDGRYVAYDSFASNLVDRDNNNDIDVFVRDRVAKTTRRVSIATGGGQGNGNSEHPSISADGRYVAFCSRSSNLVKGDTNVSRDIFVRDRVARTTQRVSIPTGGGQGHGANIAPSISADGRYVAFESFAPDLVAGDTNGAWDVFVRDRVARTTLRVSVGLGGDEAGLDSRDAAISADGRYVAFESDATNLVPGDTNDEVDVFLRDLETQLTQRVSLGPGGTEGNSSSRDAAISADGGNVAFTSFASNLVPGDTNGWEDVFLWDRETQVIQRVSVGPGGAEANRGSQDPAFPARGRYLAFTSLASNLVTGDNNNYPDVFVRDLVAEVNRRVPLDASPPDFQASGSSGMPSVARRGRYVAFVSNSSDLVARDTNDVQDVFVRELFD